ncbi:MAG: hypothetical protein EOP45_07820, partial [Sphingobacteriaceae bacterium]
MEKFYDKLQKVTLFVAFLILCSTFSQAQTLTVGSVGTGNYTSGSSIAVPFTINTSTGCIKPDNVFELYISSVPSGAPDTKIGTYNGFYSTFVNGTIPAGLATGSYNLAIKSTKEPVTSSIVSINIVLGDPVIAKLTSNATSTPNSQYPDVFGNCSGSANSYNFANASTANASVNASFYDEIAKTARNFTVNSGIAVSVEKDNYTIYVTATLNGITGTRAYQLINNQLSTNFGSNSSNPVCITNGQGILNYSILPEGVKNNYPGNLYRVDWGDGTYSEYTYCDLVRLNGDLPHPYTSPSCTSGNADHTFKVTAQVSSKICGNLGQPISTSAVVVLKPENLIEGPGNVCLNVPVTFTNKSFPGQDASSANCENNNALYTWYVDGTPIAFDQPLGASFTYTFTTRGLHKIRLQFQSQSNTICGADDFEKEICVLAPPTPRFTLPTTPICTTQSVIPVDESDVDQSCNAIPENNAYNWTITGPNNATTPVFINNTSPQSHRPEIKFATPGLYTLTLSINTLSCGAVSISKTITVNSSPTVYLSPDKPLCGKNQILTFGNNAGDTQTIFTGTATDQPDTYSWTVTGGNYTYKNGTDANSKYPQILFSDFGTYTITATQTNNCGTASDSQQLTFLESPTVNAGPDQAICPGNVVHLDGGISNPQPQSFRWSGGNGIFSPNQTTLDATYTPTAEEVNLGQVKLTLTAITGYPSPCDQLQDEIIISIKPRNAVTSAQTKSICTGNPVAYQPTAQLAGSTFSWTSAVTSGSVNGNTGSGSGNINDNLTGNGTVTYTITPAVTYASDNITCPGTSFTLTVTVTPRPVVTATPAATTVCSGQAINIGLTADLAGTTFKWTSVATAGISGNTNQTAINTTAITDILSNSSNNTTGSVTYTITPVGPSPDFCEGTPVTVTINVLPLPVVANAGADEPICAATSYTLNGNNPGISSGVWTKTSGPAGVTFDNANQY